MENSRQFLLLRTDILQQTVVGAPDLRHLSYHIIRYYVYCKRNFILGPVVFPSSGCYLRVKLQSKFRFLKIFEEVLSNFRSSIVTFFFHGRSIFCNFCLLTETFLYRISPTAIRLCSLVGQEDLRQTSNGKERERVESVTLHA